MGGFDLQNMMQMARQQYEAMQQKMRETVVEGSAGGGSVIVKMDGAKHILGVKIDPEVVKADDLEMLQDLVAAAVNEAGRKGRRNHEVGHEQHVGRLGTVKVSALTSLSSFCHSERSEESPDADAIRLLANFLATNPRPENWRK